MRNSADSTKAGCDRRDLLKLAGGALFGNAAVRLGLTASVAATSVMVAALPIYAQPEKKEITEMRSSEKFNGKVMFDWMTDLKDKDVSVRERAIASLKVYGKAAREAAPLIIKAIKDPDMSLRVNAIITLGFIGIDPKDRQSGIDALKGRLTTDEQQGIVRFQAIRALGRLGRDGYDAVPFLIRATQYSHCWEIRAAAVSALASTGWDPAGGFDVGAFKAAVECLQDKCLEVRVQSLLTLINFGTPDVRNKRNLENTLRGLIADRNQHKRVVLWARVALLRIQDENARETPKLIKDHLPLIGKLLKDNDLETRTNAARAIAFIGEKAKLLVPELIEALGDNDYLMIYWACVALGSIGPGAAAASGSLEGLKSHPDPAVKKAAIEALEKIGRKPVP